MSILNTLKFVSTHPLNRHRSDRGLFGFARWQIGSRLLGGQSIHNWVNGTRFIAHRGETGLTGNIYCGLHEFHDMGYLLHALVQDDFFADVGANVGSYTLLAGAAREARVVCVEPVPSTYRRLLDNIRLNDLSDRVRALNVGLADRDGELVFTAGGNCVNHVAVDGDDSADRVRVPVSTLDAVLGGACPSIIKIDVEGFESAVLTGAQETLRNPALHSLIVELNGSGARYGFDEGVVLQMLAECGFVPCSYEPFSRTLQLLKREGKAGNTLFVRDFESACRRVKLAPRIQVAGVWL